MARYSRDEIGDAVGLMFIPLYIGLFIASCAAQNPILGTMLGWLATVAFIASVYTLIVTIIALPAKLRKLPEPEDLPPVSPRPTPPSKRSPNTQQSEKSP
jgi:predicted MFS family arabinose efflux permease